MPSLIERDMRASSILKTFPRYDGVLVSSPDSSLVRQDILLTILSPLEARSSCGILFQIGARYETFMLSALNHTKLTL